MVGSKNGQSINYLIQSFFHAHKKNTKNIKNLTNINFIVL